MKAYKIQYLVQKDEILEDVVISLNNEGKIISISQDEPHSAEEIRGMVLPGFQNAHSHSFQYAMAGMAELHAHESKSNDFWSWRTSMYKIALQIGPEQLQSVARMLYSEMLRYGYTQVAEFHYLHHDKGGVPYFNLSEMGERLIAAAESVGIKISLIPIFYQKGGFGKEAQSDQRRFISPDADAYFSLLEASQHSASHYDGANVAQGIHSLRAVDEFNFKEVVKEKAPGIPLHLHISEQLKEVEECLAFYKSRPVEWLMNQIDLNEDFHLVHATHLSQEEMVRLAQSSANVVICPSTEGNLGDGIFPLLGYHDLCGRWCIGTDSHISLNFPEELRILDYGQRLRSHRRRVYQDDQQSNPALFALGHAILNGRKAMGYLSENFFEIGADFDAVVIDLEHPMLSSSNPELKLTSYLYSMDPNSIKEVYIRGSKKVTEGRHIDKVSIWKEYKSALDLLKFRG
jgi:formimidoylglutamate deiminase